MGRKRLYEGTAKERHREAMRQLRKKRKEERKAWLAEHPLKIYVNDDKPNVAKELLENPTPSKAPESSEARASCGACRLRDILDCNVYRRFSVAKTGKCSQFKPWEVKT